MLEALDLRRRTLDYKKGYIAKRMKCSPTKVSLIFKGKQLPKLDDMWKLMDILHIEPEEMAQMFPKPKKVKQ